MRAAQILNAAPVFITYDETTSQWIPKIDDNEEYIADKVTEVIQNCGNDHNILLFLIVTN